MRIDKRFAALDFDDEPSVFVEPGQRVITLAVDKATGAVINKAEVIDMLNAAEAEALGATPAPAREPIPFDARSAPFVTEALGDALDLETRCEIAGAEHVRYADEAWSGWLSVYYLEQAERSRADIVRLAKRAAAPWGDEPGLHKLAFERAVWRGIHDRCPGVDDASDPWSATFGSLTAEDVVAGAIANAVAAARAQGAGLAPGVEDELLNELKELLA